MRRHHLVSSALAALVLFLAAPHAFAGGGADLVSYLSPTVNAVVGVNVEQLRGTDTWSRVVGLAEQNDDVGQLLSGIEGFDPRTAVTTVVLASTQVSDDFDDEAIVLIEAVYPRDALIARLVQEGMVLEEGAAVPIYRQGRKTVALLSDSLLAMGHYDLVQTAVGVAAGGDGAGPAGLVAAQVNAADKSKTIWVAADLPAGTEGIEAAHAVIDLSAGMGLTMVMAMENADRANEAVADYTAQMAVVSGSPEMQALGVGAIFNSIQVAADGANVNLSLAVDAATWNTTLATLLAIAEEELR